MYAWAAGTGVADSTPPELRLFDATHLKGLPQFSSSFKEGLLWGTYNSGSYLGTPSSHGCIPAEYVMLSTVHAGLQMQLPKPLLAGLMWLDPDRSDALRNIRHLAEARDGALQPACTCSDQASFTRWQLL